jgi:hypothetical protein
VTATSPLPQGQLLKDPPLIAARIARSRPAGRLAAVAARWGPWSTPAVLRAARLLVVVLLALAAVIGVAAAAARGAAIDEIAHRIEPLSADTAAVYRTLADADAAVISGFVGGATEPGELRRRVDDDLAVASAGLVRAAGRADDQAGVDAISTLGRQLPEYAGLVELARASQGDRATGEAALRRASHLMQTGMLPAAEELLQRQANLLDAAYLSAAAVSVVLLGLVLVLAAVMIALQVWMARRFRRGLNLGMVTASAAVVAGALWWTISGFVSANHVAGSQAHGQAISDALVPAQIAALQARTTEGLSLVDGDSARWEPGFDERMRRVEAAAGPVTEPVARARVQEALAGAAAYREAHARVRQAVADGRSADAVRLALSTEPGSAASAFVRLDAGLAAAVDAERASFADRTRRAWVWIRSSGAVIAVLALLGIAATVIGIEARLREYP